MSIQAQYTAVPKVGTVQISTANINRDGTGTLSTLFTAGTNGSRVEQVLVKAVGTTTAGQIRIFLNDGVDSKLLTELIVDAVTPSGTSVTAFEGGINLAIVIPTGYSLKVSTQNAETFNVFAIGGDF